MPNTVTATESKFAEIRRRLKQFARRSPGKLASARYDSSDIAQLSCLQIWQAWQEVERAGISELVVNDGLLKKICHGKASNLVRYHYADKRSVQAEVDGVDRIGVNIDDPQAAAELNEQRIALVNAIQELDEVHREIILHRYVSALTLREIAERMNLSIDWVHRHLKKALETVAKTMDSEMN